MRINILFLLFLLNIFYSEAKEPIEPWYKWYKNFRGVEISGFSTSKFKEIAIGAEFRKDNWASFNMFRHSSDQLYSSNGLYVEIHRYFPITKIKITPFPLLTISTNNVTSKVDEPLSKGVLGFINGVTVSLGGGVFYEPNKYLQIGGSLNYEWQYVFEQKSNFYFRPLIHLKYEFRFI